MIKLLIGRVIVIKDVDFNFFLIILNYMEEDVVIIFIIHFIF